MFNKRVHLLLKRILLLLLCINIFILVSQGRFLQKAAACR